LNGISVLAAKAVHVQNCVVKNFGAAGGSGIQLVNAAGTTQLFVTDTVISNNGSGTSGSGVLVRPTGGASSRVVLQRVTVEGNVFGVRVDGGGSSGGTGHALVLRDSVVSGNSQAGVSVVVPAGGEGASLFVERSAVVANGGGGISADGAAAVAFAAQSTITLNINGINRVNGGQVFSFKTNNVVNNAPDGTFTPSQVGQQ
jgi:hypothetical protein